MPLKYNRKKKVLVSFDSLNGRSFESNDKLSDVLGVSVKVDRRPVKPFEESVKTVTIFVNSFNSANEDSKIE